jgi:predicted glycosyltransferase
VKTRLNILICPLEWGLGHAARMIPVARELVIRGHNVIIASGEEHLSFLRKELPGLTFIHFPGFNPSYSRHLPQYLTLLLKVPSLIRHIVKEHRQLDSLIDKHKIDIVISDNRFGLWNRRVRTAYVTHMPRIPFPVPFRFLEPLGITLHRLIIRKYDLCLIPDLPGELNLTGRLTHGFRQTGNTRFTGILSRLSTAAESPAGTTAGGKYLAILSGPEPQRSIFRKYLTEALKTANKQAVILEGKPGREDLSSDTNPVESYSHADAAEIRSMILSASSIITRSGYTTIMELVSLGRSALLVPTPGQTEQEYLAEYMKQKGWFTNLSQKNLSKGIPGKLAAERIPAELAEQSAALLAKALDELLEYQADK